MNKKVTDIPKDIFFAPIGMAMFWVKNAEAGNDVKYNVVYSREDSRILASFEKNGQDNVLNFNGTAYDIESNEQIEDIIQVDENGNAEFRCNGGSVSVWIKK